MKFSSPVPVTSIAKLIGAQLIGNEHANVQGINEIHVVEPGDLVFVDHPKYYDACLNSAASFIIINTSDVTVPEGKTILVTKDPFESYLTIVHHFNPVLKTTEPIAASAFIGEGTYIMPQVFIGNHVRIGKNCSIYPGVCILDNTIIGDNVIIQAGSIIGSDAFYYNTKKNRDQWFKKMESCGTVVLEDGVEIGAGCTIDRGVTSVTKIGAGTKLDNQVHVGHDAIIGKNCLFAAQVGIAGGTTIEDGVTLWGQVGVNKTITIGAGAVVLGKSGVANHLEGGKVYFGAPAIEASIKRKELVWIKRIPELWKKVMD
ncbi:MAG: UDP-3-O-(3-hydroxymyristoyl)glucosamine N-acyltransferase [Bacteroidetes bacterium]|jgi:UDP-3-O-[3-hydroxymyristoyl] glucosamine N-acyltransferase|nr:UDP-3-O-(3-hydroxymyristoyl)glucosamine N-acyltransferase [Bacteroidota bacterium]